MTIRDDLALTIMNCFGDEYRIADMILERFAVLELPAPTSTDDQDGVPIARWDWDQVIIPVIARGRVVIAGAYRFNLDRGADPHKFIAAVLAATETARNNPPEQ